MVRSKKRKKNQPNEHALGERWTPLIATKGFTPVPNILLNNYAKLNITLSEAMLLIHLLSFKWTSEAPFPAVTRLAKLMGCSERNVRKICASLESVGYLKRVERSGTSNQFDLSGLYGKLEEIINAERAATAPPVVPVEQPHRTLPPPGVAHLTVPPAQWLPQLAPNVALPPARWNYAFASAAVQPSPAPQPAPIAAQLSVVPPTGGTPW